MREIKYRYWYNNTKMIEVGSIQFFTDGTYIVNDELTGGILLECTGLKDKNGKEIYEGDILKYHWKNPFKGQEAEGDAYFVVDYYEGSMIVRNLESYKKGEWGYGGQINFLRTEPETKYHGATSIEVIGNIYENPDLLKI